MEKDKIQAEKLTKREQIALEVLKILLPEVQVNSIFKKTQTYDSMARDSVYTADALIQALDNK